MLFRNPLFNINSHNNVFNTINTNNRINISDGKKYINDSTNGITNSINASNNNNAVNNNGFSTKVNLSVKIINVQFSFRVSIFLLTVLIPKSVPALIIGVFNIFRCVMNIVKSLSMSLLTIQFIKYA